MIVTFLAFLLLIFGVRGETRLLESHKKALKTLLNDFTFHDVAPLNLRSESAIHEARRERALNEGHDYLEYSLCGKALETAMLDNGDGLKSVHKGVLVNECIVCSNSNMPLYKSCKLELTVQEDNKFSTEFNLYTDESCSEGEHTGVPVSGVSMGACYEDLYSFTVLEDEADVRPILEKRVGFSVVAYRSSQDCGNAVSWVSLGAVEGACINDVKFESCDGNTIKLTTYNSGGGGNCARQPNTVTESLDICHDFTGEGDAFWNIPENEGFEFQTEPKKQTGDFVAVESFEKGMYLSCPSLYSKPEVKSELPINQAVAIGFGVSIGVCFCCGVLYWLYRERSGHSAKLEEGLKKTDGIRAAQRAAEIRGSMAPSPMHSEIGRL